MSWVALVAKTNELAPDDGAMPLLIRADLISGVAREGVAIDPMLYQADKPPPTYTRLWCNNQSIVVAGAPSEVMRHIEERTVDSLQEAMMRFDALWAAYKKKHGVALEAVPAG